ncbi:uncharacterized protein LOC111925846 isoform X1 [Cyanistes caeruleus]|uniref:uncharacterized protein LOC111925846 isoform X1 n=1 Tax=Cyanistes caeruleus TaxID=156563 RepID=UPI000CDACF03|nr:uncharacterized protein LOC111925846 isoform X1 [Cyanistes caeruleus]
MEKFQGSEGKKEDEEKKYLDVISNKNIKLSERVLIPVKQYPKSTQRPKLRWRHPLYSIHLISALVFLQGADNLENTIFQTGPMLHENCKGSYWLERFFTVPSTSAGAELSQQCALIKSSPICDQVWMTCYYFFSLQLLRGSVASYIS